MYRPFVALLGPLAVLRFNRKTILIVTGGLICVGDAVFAYSAYIKDNEDDGYSSAYRNWLPIAAVFMIYTGFASGYAATIYGLQGELLPARFR